MIATLLLLISTEFTACIRSTVLRLDEGAPSP